MTGPAAPSRYDRLRDIPLPDLVKGLDQLGEQFDAGEVHVPTFCAWIEERIARLASGWVTQERLDAWLETET